MVSSTRAFTVSFSLSESLELELLLELESESLELESAIFSTFLECLLLVLVFIFIVGDLKSSLFACDVLKSNFIFRFATLNANEIKSKR